MLFVGFKKQDKLHTQKLLLPGKSTPQEGHGNGVGVVPELWRVSPRHPDLLGHNPGDEDVFQMKEGPLEGTAQQEVHGTSADQVGGTRHEGRVAGGIVLLWCDEILKKLKKCEVM